MNNENLNSTTNHLKNILVTGGAGYVGSVLVPLLLSRGYNVRVLDLYIYGRAPLSSVRDNDRLEEVEGDIRDQNTVSRALKGIDAVIHLSCISNDPSFELDPELGKSINFDSFEPFVQSCVDEKIKRFIFASSSSVYGIKTERDVTEDLPLEPLTDYSKFKAMCEEILLKYESDEFIPLVIRPATVCGYSPRMRLDLTVNLLTNHAINNGIITVFGGNQLRPNIHIKDISELYVQMLEIPSNKISGKIFNAGYDNLKVSDIANKVKELLPINDVEIIVQETDDNRSYHISSKKIYNELGFKPKYTVDDAINEIYQSFQEGLLTDPMTNPLYFNIQQMKTFVLK